MRRLLHICWWRAWRIFRNTYSCNNSHGVRMAGYGAWYVLGGRGGPGWTISWGQIVVSSGTCPSGTQGTTHITTLSWVASAVPPWDKTPITLSSAHSPLSGPWPPQQGREDFSRPYREISQIKRRGKQVRTIRYWSSCVSFLTQESARGKILRKNSPSSVASDAQSMRAWKQTGGGGWMIWEDR